MADQKPTRAERDDFEKFARAASGLYRGKPATGGPIDGTRIPDSARSDYMGKHATTVNHNDATARKLSGKHDNELTGVPPRDPRDPKRKG
jgi:hypothetical protein